MNVQLHPKREMMKALSTANAIMAERKTIAAHQIYNYKINANKEKELING